MLPNCLTLHAPPSRFPSISAVISFPPNSEPAGFGIVYQAFDPGNWRERWR